MAPPGRRGGGVWKAVGALLAVIVALTLVGLVLKALRWLLVVALVLVVLTAVAGSLTRRDGR